MIKKDLIFLKEPFLKWLEEKREYIKQHKNFDYKKNAKEILAYDSYDIETIDSFIKKFINNFPPSVIKLLVERISAYYSEWIDEKIPEICSINFIQNEFPNALNWTIVNVYELKFFDMSNIDFEIPYNQCHYCGKPDEFEHKNGIKKFNKKSKFCHCYYCEYLNYADGSRPNLHKNCHYGKYALIKRKLYQKMTTGKRTKEEKIKIFINDFCEKRLQENHKINWSIQTKNRKAILKKYWYEDGIWDSNSKLDNIIKKQINLEDLLKNI